MIISIPFYYCQNSAYFLKGLRVAQVKVIFALPHQLSIADHPQYLAYIEWFTPFQSFHPVLGMYSVSRSTQNHRQNIEVVSLSQIIRSCHLLPKFGTLVNKTWHSDTILDDAPGFYLNVWLDLFTFFLLQCSQMII
ncbi:hypothetical protein JAAARDRAFT_125881 [Jaapia argillacea MUCL 33604]|uniref:Uncharacterized protein n=1 Tax=Jaapia argillacea MUCL 33604 TaxID=933084 RepID=A0A067PZ38_9AGAM|nr:hypothetical protein JAAARDRAFT_125881 [Jaapia argillacea MUCL 33604]